VFIQVIHTCKQTYDLKLPSSTISPIKTFAIPDMAITTFWETEFPVIVCTI